ncbi:alpha/beta hydrolase [Umezawaea tangerina]|uniref:Alpha/beta hydrolase family protein n=1 Tax=Umezawaea tangerina TaxID=84725 RepID=A0A2T0SGA3_9PSEU|nr:alpha/beta hydrolase [Umezawaea tangerina]PRY32435.1 alpha/beta hydrolase family protein [Umezawaea tangerina]
MIRRTTVLIVVGVTAIAAAATGVALAETNAANTAEHGAGAIAWQPCPTGDVALECGRVTVPVHWRKPDGGTISLKVARLPATGRRLGSVVVNPGGPGIPGTRFLVGYATRFGTALRSSFDIVSWDPRGVGESAPIGCPGIPRDSGDVPASVTERERFEQATATWATACRDAVGPLFDTVDTVSTVRDLDQLRRQLGERKLNYYGVSYGTRIGQFYADLFPDRVGRMTIDSVVDTTSQNAEFVDGAARAKEEAFADYVATCADRAGCPLTGMTLPDVRSRLVPLIAEEPAVGGEIVGDLTSPASWPKIDEHLTKVLAGTYQPEEGPDVSGDVLNDDVNCLDVPDHRSARQVVDDSALAADRYPLFGRLFAATTVCNRWPAPATYRPHRITAPVPVLVLVVGTTHDTATPYDWAVRAAENLGTGRLLTRRATDHGAYGKTDCVTTAVDRFFVDGALPPVGQVCVG